MKTEISSRERMLSTVAGSPVDHVPLSFDIHPSYGRYEPKVANWKDQFERTDFLLACGIDPMVEIWLPEPSFDPDVAVRSWKGRDGKGILLFKEYETPEGTLRHVIRETPDLYTWHKINRNMTGPIADLIDGVGLLEDVNPSRTVEFPIKGPKNLKAMRHLFQPPTGEQLRSWREEARFTKEQAEQRSAALLARRVYDGSAILWLTDAVETMCAYETDPGFVQEFLDIIHQWQLKLLDLVLDIGVDMVTRFGYYDTPDFWGLKHFERFVKPLMDEQAERCEAAGAYLSQQQSEGLTLQREIYKTMRVHILREVDPVQGGEDMALLKKELGRTKTLMGGINCDLSLAQASREEVDETVRSTLDLMAPGGRFIMHLIPGIYAGVPWEKVEWLIESWRRYA